MEPYWNETNGHAPHSVKYESEAAVSSFPYCTESSLNFSTSATAYSEDDAEYATGRRNKTSRQDPLSHRIIEKRRRDRMNSCLADLSRLIPPQYQRKGRGRIEKTEIIEMAIRHLKHLQNECLQKENDYRSGYTDCMKETAKFLYDNQMQELGYRLLARLQEHCDEAQKNDCFRTRNCHLPADNVSASSGSPHQTFHASQPICQLREMLGTSDIEHSNDHNDVKDLSFRNHINQLQRNNGVNADHSVTSNSTTSSSTANTVTLPSTTNSGSGSGSNSTAATTAGTLAAVCGGGALSKGGPLSQPHQAPVITSTATSSSLHHHTDSSNHDFESSREPILHTDTSNMHSPPPRDSLSHHHHTLLQNHHHHLQHTNDGSLLSSARLRNFSESSHEIEHNNNNNYKYKNHIKDRFNHELHDDETSSDHGPAPPLLQSEHSHAHSDHSKDGTEPEIAPIMAKKRKLAEAAAAAAAAAATLNGTHDENIINSTDARSPLNLNGHSNAATSISTTTGILIGSGVGVGGANTNLHNIDEKPKFSAFGDIKTELLTSNSNSSTNQLTKIQLNNNSNGLVGAVTATSSSTSSPPVVATANSQSRSFAVPIFALHSQGTYYVPLNVDFNVLVPYLNGIDLLEKNYTTMPVVHPININVNFMPATPSASLLAAAAAAAAVAAGKQQTPGVVVNGHHHSNHHHHHHHQISAVHAAAVAKAKIEAITNGW